MTPSRAKRNSKAPERFSSDDIKTDLINGSSHSNHGDKSNSKAGSKFRVMQETFKVKLPKLKRFQAMQFPSPTKESIGTTNFGSILAKIKLPPKRPIQKAKASDSPRHGVNTTPKSTPDSKFKPTAHKRSDLSLLASSNNKIGNGNAYQSANQFPKEELNKPDSDSTAIQTHQSRLSGEASIEEVNKSSGIRCACGVDDDLGVMVECEKCSNWQHGHCINVGQEDDAYEGYICAYCLLPPGGHDDSLHQLAINDKLRSKFENLEASMKVRHDDSIDPDDGSGDQITFSLDELKIATADLRRVSNSLEAKWKLLISDDYNAELKIWANPIWSDDPEENRNQQNQTVRFVGDIYKGNLKLNICSMLNLMHKRCQLIRYQISRTDICEEETQSEYDKLLVILDQIASVVEQVTDRLKTI